MKHQRQFGTEGGIASRAAVKQIRILISGLARTARILDAYITAGEKHPRARDLSDPDDPVLARMLSARRRNLMITIAALEDRLGSIESLGSIEKMRSRGNRRNVQARRSPRHGSRVEA
jgi:hypothetical protein